MNNLPLQQRFITMMYNCMFSVNREESGPEKPLHHVFIQPTRISTLRPRCRRYFKMHFLLYITTVAFWLYLILPSEVHYNVIMRYILPYPINAIHTLLISIYIQISLQFGPRGPIKNKPALVQIMTWPQIMRIPTYKAWCVESSYNSY